MAERLPESCGLALGEVVSDPEFDLLLPPELRRAGEDHWTPAETAQRAAQLLTEHGATRVLDVGSGVGKFCIIGALTTGASFTGVEQRPHLVAAGRELVRRHAIPRVRFIHGKMEDLDWAEYDGLYFFNPFHEHLTRPSQAVDQSIELSQQLHAFYTRVVYDKLERLAPGVPVATYHGIGAPLPDDFELMCREPSGSLVLDLWVKRAAA